MSNSDKIFKILICVSSTPGHRISEKKLVDLLDVSRSQYFKLKKELLEDNNDRPAILVEVKLDFPTGETIYDKTNKKISKEQNFYKLNESGWRQFLDAQLEGKFYLESYKEIGHLLDSDYDDITYNNQIASQKDISNLKRKFLYLSKVQARPYPVYVKDALNEIICSLLGNNYLHIVYSGVDNKKSHILRKVKPLTLCQYRDDLYLIGLEEIVSNGKSTEEKRTYKITRILEIKKLTETFKYPATTSWNPKEIYKYTSGLIDGNVKTCTLKVFNSSRIIFKEKSVFNSKLMNSNDQFDEYECTYTSINEFLGQLFVYAQDVQIISPPEISKAFIEKATNAINLQTQILDSKKSA